MTERTLRILRTPLRPIVALLTLLHVTPDAITIVGLVLSIVTGYLLSRGWFLAGGVVLLFAGLSDTVDGELARRSNRARPLGAFLDSSFDRLSEFAEFFGLFWFFTVEPRMAALIFGTLFASLAVSYVRARAEGIGIECRVGLFERPVRFLFLVVGVFFHRWLPIALWIILVGSTFTVIQRMAHVLSKARKTSP